MNEANFPTFGAGSWAPWQFINGDVASGTTALASFPITGCYFLATALDIGIVAAVTSGYVQFFTPHSGATIWVEQPNGVETSYASWRGAFFGSTTDGMSVYNNTTSAIGITLFGWIALNNWTSIGVNNPYP